MQCVIRVAPFAMFAARHAEALESIKSLLSMIRSLTKENQKRALTTTDDNGDSIAAHLVKNLSDCGSSAYLIESIGCGENLVREFEELIKNL